MRLNQRRWDSEKRVLISYSHESEAHKAWVTRLAEDLARLSIDAFLDHSRGRDAGRGTGAGRPVHAAEYSPTRPTASGQDHNRDFQRATNLLGAGFRPTSGEWDAMGNDQNATPLFDVACGTLSDPRT